MSAEQFLGHEEVTVAHGTEAEGLDVVPRRLALGIGNLLGEAEVGILLAVTNDCVDCSGVNAVVKGHLGALGGIPALSGAEVVHVTDDEHIINNGCGISLLVGFYIGILALLDGDGEVIGAGENLEGIGSTPITKSGLRTIHNKRTILDSAATIGQEAPVISVLTQLRGETEVAIAITAITNDYILENENVINVFTRIGVHLDTSRGIPVVAIHLTENK